MKKSLTLATVFLALLIAGFALGQETATHDVSVTIEAVDSINVDRDVNFRVNEWSDYSATLTNSLPTLSWKTNQADRRITVESDLIGTTAHSLLVDAAPVDADITAVQRDLADVLDTSKDLLTGIQPSESSATLTFSFTPKLSMGTGTTTYRVIYTLTGSD